jgi:hypothetical protein
MVWLVLAMLALVLVVRWRLVHRVQPLSHASATGGDER